jgi:uncharacterized damage-inducible protein DinB
VTEKQIQAAIDAAEKNPEEVARAVSGMSKQAMDRRPGPNQWSIHEILAHLADSEIVFAHRLRQALADREPAFASEDQEAWAKELGYLETLPAEMVAQYALLRRSNVRLLRRMKAGDWEKGGFDPGQGRKVTVRELAQSMTEHDLHHLREIDAAKGKAAAS